MAPQKLVSLMAAAALVSAHAHTTHTDILLPMPEGNPVGPIEMSPTLDCAVRSLAYNFSLHLLPQRAPLTDVFDALRLAADCNMSTPSSVAAPPRTDYAQLKGLQYMTPDAGERLVAAQHQNAGVQYYADPVNGDDNNAGTLGAPFKTIGRAVEAARSTAGPVQVILRNGTFFLPAPIVLTEADSGLTIAAYGGETPVISGGAPLPQLTWTAWNVTNVVNGPYVGVTDVNGCVDNPGDNSSICEYGGNTPDAASCATICIANAQCNAYTWHDSNQGAYALMCYMRVDGVWAPSQQSGHTSGYKLTLNVWQASLAGVTGTDWSAVNTIFMDNRRAIRARYPNANPETQQVPIGYLSAQSWLPPLPEGPHQDISIPSPSRAYDVYFPTYNWGIGGSVAQFTPPESFWEVTSPDAGSHYEVPGGVVLGADVAPRMAAWGGGAFVNAFHSGYWGSWVFEVDSVNASGDGTLTFSRGGFQEARGSGSGGHFYVDNLLAELDAPGEWYLDIAAETLYVFFNGTGTPTQPDMIVSQLQNLITLSGTASEPVVNVTLAGLTFAHTQATFMESYTAGAGGDWSFRKDATVTLTGTVGATVADCTFWSPGGNGLILADYNRDANVVHNEFVWTGESAIVSHGSTDLMDGTAGNVPANSVIAYNFMHEIGVYVKQVGCYYHGVSANASVIGNVCFNIPRAGVNVNDGYAGGHTVYNNLIFNSVRETSDHGCFNSWDRLPMMFNASNLTQLTPVLSVISNNFLINNYASTWPIDHDDGSNTYLALENVMPWGGFKNYLGFAKSAIGNLYIYPDYSPATLHPSLSLGDVHGKYNATAGGWPNCAMSYGTSAWPAPLRDVWSNNTCIIGNAGNIYKFQTCTSGNPNDGNFPALADNTLYADSGNYTFSCGSDTWTLAQAQALGVEVGTAFTSGAPPQQQILAMAQTLLGF